MDEYFSSEPSIEDRPTGERWDPLGAPNDQDEETSSVKASEHDCCDRAHWYIITNVCRSFV